MIKPKSKVNITKGPLERLVVNGWELDEELKAITGFNWVIDLVDYFSKFIKCIPIKNNNANNILFCLKEFFNYIGKPLIFQTDNGFEYNNSIIINFLESNNVKHIFSSPRHPQRNGVVEDIRKEIRKNILTYINQIEDEISFRNIIS